LKKLLADTKGAAMILAACVSAITVVLCLTIVLTAASVRAIIDGESDLQQSKVWATSLTIKLQDELMSGKTFETLDDENASRAQNPNALWFYMMDNVISPTAGEGWRYYNEDEFGHNHNFADRVFNVSASGFSEGEGDMTVTMYWESESGTNLKNDSVSLVIIVQSTVGGKTSRIRSTYLLNYNEIHNLYTDDLGEPYEVLYDQWVWSLSERE